MGWFEKYTDIIINAHEWVAKYADAVVGALTSAYEWTANKVKDGAKWVANKAVNLYNDITGETKRREEEEEQARREQEKQSQIQAIKQAQIREVERQKAEAKRQGKLAINNTKVSESTATINNTDQKSNFNNSNTTLNLNRNKFNNGTNNGTNFNNQNTRLQR